MTRTCLGASPDIHQVSLDHDNLLHCLYCYIVLHFGQLWSLCLIHSFKNICISMMEEEVYLSIYLVK